MPTRFSVDGVPSAIYSICQPESWEGGSVQKPSERQDTVEHESPERIFKLCSFLWLITSQIYRTKVQGPLLQCSGAKDHGTRAGEKGHAVTMCPILCLGPTKCLGLASTQGTKHEKNNHREFFARKWCHFTLLPPPSPSVSHTQCRVLHGRCHPYFLTLSTCWARKNCSGHLGRPFPAPAPCL